MDANELPQIEKDIAELSAMLEGSEDLQNLTRSPLVSAQAQQAALSALCERAQFSGLTRNFLMVLAQNRRLSQLGSMLKAVRDNLSARRGEMMAKVESATELSGAQKQALAEQLSKTVGRPVAIEASVNKALIGGVTVTLGSLMIDDSIRAKLDRMGRAMKYQGNKAA